MKKILIISDIAWEREQNPVNHFKQIIVDINPNSVIFLGDIIDDGCNHNVHADEFISLTNAINCRSYILWGNHDYYSPDEREKVKNKLHKNKKVHFINNIFFKLYGYKCLGISHDITGWRKKTKEFYRDNCNKKVDIIFAHCLQRRRIFLLQWKPKFIVTGHFGFGEVKINETRFISNCVFPSFHSILLINERGMEIDQFHDGVNMRRYNWMIRNHNNNIELGKQYELLLNAKERYEKIQNNNDKIDLFEELLYNRVPTAWIEEFITDSNELREAKRYWHKTKNI